jgi:hypothetical protein
MMIKTCNLSRAWGAPHAETVAHWETWARNHLHQTILNKAPANSVLVRIVKAVQKQPRKRTPAERLYAKRYRLLESAKKELL